MKFDYDLVGKIGSMALIRRADNDIDYNIFSRLGAELRPGMIWVSSGATEIGRLDYIRRNGKELTGDREEIKADYAAQGQTILMMEYRRYIPDRYSVRQLLVEHTHFNDEEKRKHIRGFLLRAAKQNAIPIVNYNDPVSIEEIRKMDNPPDLVVPFHYGYIEGTAENGKILAAALTEAGIPNKLLYEV